MSEDQQEAFAKEKQAALEVYSEKCTVVRRLLEAKQPCSDQAASSGSKRKRSDSPTSKELSGRKRAAVQATNERTQRALQRQLAKDARRGV